MVMKNKKKYQDILKFIGIIALLVVVNFVASKKYVRLDLTADKRFTLTDATVNLVTKLDDVVEFKVYLTGDNLPAKFVEFKEQVRSRLEEFRNLNPDNIEYEFIDPYAVENHEDFIRELTQKGLQYTNVSEKTENGTNQVYIVPGVMVYYKGRNYPVNFLNTEITANHIEVLNKSIQSLEHNLTTAIRILKKSKKDYKVVGFLQGHGELDGRYINDLANSLSDYYMAGPVMLTDTNGAVQLNALDGVDALVIAKPRNQEDLDAINNIKRQYFSAAENIDDKMLSEEEKFVIDQFIMRGGVTVWMIDQVKAEMDSLRVTNIFPAMINKLNTEEMLYNYGVRINNNLVEDAICAPITMQVGKYGNKPDYKQVQWVYFPMITTNNEHITTTNLDPIKLNFANTIDTIPTPGTNKTILLSTSENCKIVKAPVRVGFDVAINGADKSFNQGKKPVAVLLEGTFNSYYKNRIPPFANVIGKNESKVTKMLVISDGDIAKNEFVKGQPLPLGADMENRLYFDNKKFLLNAFNYLLGDEDIIQARSKKIQMRLLNRAMVHEKGNQIKAVNIAVPLAFIVIFGLLYNAFRTRKYARK
jgi:ABC-2 type transport system permease protein